MPKKYYEYMVVYRHPYGLGRQMVTTTYKIKAYDQIEELDKACREATKIEYSMFAVIDFKLLRTYWKWK